jgi:predicted glutamine amidotransferase
MCQLLGMNCNTPTDITFSFTGFAQRGGKTDHHADGWGVAFFEGDGLSGGKGLRHFVDHASAATSPVAELISRYPIKSQNVIAHIRKATQGVVALENCHPFVRELWGRYWVFAHNGDLKDFTPRLHGSFKPVGSTDSERAFAYIMQELAKSHCARLQRKFISLVCSTFCCLTVKPCGPMHRLICIMCCAPIRLHTLRWWTKMCMSTLPSTPRHKTVWRWW